MKELKLKAMAKINLGLDVLRKREDGYHDLRMIMQSIYLYDQIRIRQTQKPGIRLSVNLGYLPAGPENLVYKAADLLMKEFGITQGVAIDLQKYIPVAAGLAGGSSDAAAVLIGVNRLFHLGLTLEELQERGVKLGADIPYCLLRGKITFTHLDLRNLLLFLFIRKLRIQADRSDLCLIIRQFCRCVHIFLAQRFIVLMRRLQFFLTVLQIFPLAIHFT